LPVDETLRTLTTILNLRDTEAETLRAVLNHCSKFGVATGGAAAVGMAGAGSVMVPGVGAVRGWIVGFAAGWAGGTVMCTMAHRGLVIESLKQTLSSAKRVPVTESQAVVALKTELGRTRPYTSRS
jgi:hypothetical protein